jgi:hypothetical protein
MVEFGFTPARHNIQTYAYPLQVAVANTSSNPAIVGPVALPNGIVKRFWMDLPDGARDHVLAQVFLGSTQWIPAVAGTYFRGNNTVYDMEQYQDIFANNNLMTIKAWNDGLSTLVLYIHNLTFYFTIQLAEVL